MDHQNNLFALLDGGDEDASVIADRIEETKREEAERLAAAENHNQNKPSRRFVNGNGNGRGRYYRRNYGGGRGSWGRGYGQDNYRRSEALEGNDQSVRKSEDDVKDTESKEVHASSAAASDGGSVVGEVTSETKLIPKKQNGNLWKPWSEMSEEEKKAERVRKAEKRAKEIEEDKKLMTLKQYEEKLEKEKKKNMDALEASEAREERKVKVDKDFGAMKPIYKKEDSFIEEKYLLQEQPKKNSQGGGKDDKKDIKKIIIKDVFQSPGGRRFERRGGGEGSEGGRFDRRSNVQKTNNTGGQAKVNGSVATARALGEKVNIEDESQFPNLLGA